MPAVLLNSFSFCLSENLICVCRQESVGRTEVTFTTQHEGGYSPVFKASLSVFSSIRKQREIILKTQQHSILQLWFIKPTMKCASVCLSNSQRISVESFSALC